MADTNVALQIDRIAEASKLIRRILGPASGIPGEAESQKFSNTKVINGTEYKWGPWALGDGTEKIDDLAAILEDIPYFNATNGVLDFSVVEGGSKDMPMGFYEEFTITGKSDTEGDKEKYKTQAKSITPTKSSIGVKPDTGYYALSSVTVNPIPAKYQDVSATTATAADVLSGKKFTAVDGTVVTGTIKDNGSASVLIWNSTPSDVTYDDTGKAVVHRGLSGYYTAAAAYINAQQKSVTPTKSTQIIYPDTDCWLGKVTVNPIPANYITTTDATATAAQILAGKTAYVNTAKVTGSMADNGAIAATLPGFNSADGSLNGSTVDRAFKYTVPVGYHNGSGTVTANADYKSVTPTKSAQTIYPEEGHLLWKVDVAAIPSSWYDITGTTAAAGQVLAGSKFVNASGVLTTGTMANQGAKTATLDVTTTSYTIPVGYHNGSGKVSIATETKSVTPTKSAQSITPTAGKVLSSVSVAAIPAEYITTTDATAIAAHILFSFTAYVNGSKITGTMANYSSMADGAMPEYKRIYPTLNKTVLENAFGEDLDKTELSRPLGAGFYNNINNVVIPIERKTVTPTKSVQEIWPTDGYVLGEVYVHPIPAAYQDVSATTATASTVLSGYKFTNTSGTVVTGTMANNGATSKTFNPLTQTSVSIAAGYTTGGSVTLTADLENRLAAI